MLASHITSRPRLEKLTQCLRSIELQAEPAPRAFLASISAETAELMETAKRSLADFRQATAGRIQVHVTFQAARLPQFQHFAALAEPLRCLAQGEFRKAADGSTRAGEGELDADESDWIDDGDLESLWLIFTDDDDLWHPRRAQVLRGAIVDTAERSGGTLAPLSIPTYAMNLVDLPFCASAGDVDDLMRSGDIGIISYSPEEARARSFIEFWLHAVPARLFLDFLICTPPATLSHGLCDVRFSAFIREHAAHETVLYAHPTPHLLWMYFHRKHEQQFTQGLQSAAPILEEDRRASREFSWRLSGSYGAAEGRPGDDPVAQLVAELRRDVGMLILMGRIPLEDILEAILRRHCLYGTPDEALWAELAAGFAEEAIPVLAPPSPVTRHARA